MENQNNVQPIQDKFFSEFLKNKNNITIKELENQSNFNMISNNNNSGSNILDQNYNNYQVMVNKSSNFNNDNLNQNNYYLQSDYLTKKDLIDIDSNNKMNINSENGNYFSNQNIIQNDQHQIIQIFDSDNNNSEIFQNEFIRKPLPINRFTNLQSNQPQIKIFPNEVYYKYQSSNSIVNSEILSLKEKEEEKNKTHKCNCKKSRCLKLYCECFANGEYCIGCSCQDCFNTIQNEKGKLEAFNNVRDKNPVAMKLINKVNKDTNKKSNIKNYSNNFKGNSNNNLLVGSNLIENKDNSGEDICYQYNENDSKSSNNNFNKNSSLKNEIDKINSNNIESLKFNTLKEKSDLFYINMNNNNNTTMRGTNLNDNFMMNKNTYISNKIDNTDLNNNYFSNNYFNTNTNNLVSVNPNILNEQVIGCNCTKSNCMKKYCECFKAGRTCIEACRCRDCENIDCEQKELINYTICNLLVFDQRVISFTTTKTTFVFLLCYGIDGFRESVANY